MKASALEDTFLLLFRSHHLAEPEREYVFAKPRRWRFDFAWPLYKVAVEIEGGVWTRGRHLRPTGFLRDLEKYNAATMAGWRVIRLSREDVSNQVVMDWLRVVAKGRRK